MAALENSDLKRKGLQPSPKGISWIHLCTHHYPQKEESPRSDCHRETDYGWTRTTASNVEE